MVGLLNDCMLEVEGAKAAFQQVITGKLGHAIVIKTEGGKKKKIWLPSHPLLTRLLVILYNMKFSSSCNQSEVLSLPGPWKIFSTEALAGS